MRPGRNLYTMTKTASKPIGVALVGSFFKFTSITTKRTFHKALVLCVTFIAYTCYHMGRRPLSIVKNVLNQNCSNVHNVTNYTQYEDIAYLDNEQLVTDMNHLYPSTAGCGSWPPFDDDKTANQLLALLDSAFLFTYAIFMFFSGYIADRCNIRYFLSSGMILSGVLLYAFGMAYYQDTHSMTYFVIVQILSGAIQTTGWPSVVSCISNWFEPSKRGSIFGLWNANTNLGNILGAAIAGYFVEKSWGLSFIVPGFIMSACGVLVFLFLVPSPEDVNLSPIRQTPQLDTGVDCTSTQQNDTVDIEAAINSERLVDDDEDPNHRRKLTRNVSCEADSAVGGFEEGAPINDSEDSPLMSGASSTIADEEPRAASFWTCIAIPGVLEYSLCLGFAKLVSYTFLYWLPRYITQSTDNDSQQSAYLSVPFDIGGMVGAIVAGSLSDRYRKSALTCTVMLTMAIPAMFIYEQFASISNMHNIILQLITGALVNGPYSLITTAVSADLGSRVKDGKALATVAAIIDGTGSIGAAIGPLVAGYISDMGWQSVFVMLMTSDMIASFCLTRITLKEVGYRT